MARENTALANLDKAVMLISNAKSIDEAFALKALFDAAQIEARRTKTIEVEKKAAEYKLWTMDKIGQLLDEMKKQGKRSAGGNPHREVNHNPDVSVKTLKELQISPMMSSRCQKFYKLPEERKMEAINYVMRRIERRQEARNRAPTNDMPASWQTASSPEEEVERQLTIADRIANYQSHFPNHPHFMTNSEGRYDRIYGMWHLGTNSLRDDEHYGAYPPTLAERILALFPDRKTIIHLFSGSIPDNPPRVITYDVMPKFKPTICDDVANIARHASHFNKEGLLVMADPYYEQPDFDRMKQTPINKKKVLDDLAGICPSGTFLTWLDTSPVIFNSKVWQEVGLIGVRVSYNTRYRGLQVFQRW